ncbi:hypothetical protein BBK14_21825 [Parafrankia soli]|uniref:Extradiol ring-cleavage dioxygenase class III enzyme subunit B domain-containing protein n=1 Tax=Parafrankia soli TaxID=2599596 RepID=A0A1S1Q0L2_9ACTN|nr:hypothetical protein [Parafrankia soli]OHV25674.1 hypothetical protein BBK14_21825 [Parafrankia soli]
MGEVVAAMAGVHAPQLLQRFAGEEEEKLAASRAALRSLGEILDETRPDALLVIGTDHMETFSLDLVPAFTLVTGERAEGEFGGEAFSRPVHQPLARGLLDGLVARGFDLAYSQSAELGHAFATPFRFVLGDRDIPVIPLLINVYLPPLPRSRRCEALGQAIAEVIAERDERVAVLASGGMSHYPGTPKYPHPEFAVDHWIMSRIADNDLDPILDLTPEQLDEIGEGELLAWFVLWGAMGRRAPGRVLSYQEIWHHGQGVVVWEPPQDSRSGDGGRQPDGTSGRLPFAFTQRGYHYYRYPEPESYAFNRLLRDFRDPQLRARYLVDPDGVVKEYGLRQSDIDAFRTLDIDTCVAAGAHPLLAWTGCRFVARDRDAGGATATAGAGA